MAPWPGRKFRATRFGVCWHSVTPSGGNRMIVQLRGILLFRRSETNHWYCSDAFTGGAAHARSKIVRWVKRASRRAELKANGRRALRDVWSVKSFGLEFSARIKRAHRSRKQ